MSILPVSVLDYMSERTILIWFRNDLRIRDNEVLFEAARRADRVIPVYCFDPRYFGKTEFGTQKTGLLRARFLIESVRNLRSSLRRLGGGLLVRRGKPEDILPDLCNEYQVSEVYHHREVGPEETAISARVEASLWKRQINLRHFIGHTLYHKEDLPFPIRNIPDNFSIFRKKIERDSLVRPCFDTPVRLVLPDGLVEDELPELKDLGFQIRERHDALLAQFIGGEDEGLKRLDNLLAQTSHNSKANRSAASKLSPWLSIGCISSREVYWLTERHKKTAPELHSRVIVELLWRDYYRFMLKKHGSVLAQAGEAATELNKRMQKKFLNWCEGTTGDQLTDACMKELNSTGYITDISRQYAASYLVNDLGVSWRAGSAYFEQQLLDFSPATNLGSWASVLGSKIITWNKNISYKFEDVAREEDLWKWFPEQGSSSVA